MRCHAKALFLVVPLILDLANCSARVKQFGRNFKKGPKLVGHSSVTTKAQSAIACCILCTDSDVCVTANYNPPTGQCQLSDETPEINGTGIEADDVWNLYHLQGPCNDSWIHFGTSCYLLELTTPFTWIAGTQFCTDLGARLVEIEDAAENQFVISLGTSNGLTGIWLGLSDAVTERLFVWSSGALMKFEDFGNNEGIREDEDCVFLILKFEHQYYWADGFCDQRDEYVLCEKSHV